MRIKMQNKGLQRDVEEVFEEFINYCKAKNLSEKTIFYYNECFEVFSNYYDVQNCIESIAEEVIQNYTIHLMNNTNANSNSINTRLRGLRALFYYSMEKGYIPEFKIKMVKTDKEMKEPYTDDELKILLKKPNINKCEFTEFRDWAVINYVLSTGNRIATIVNIKIKDIDFENGCVKLQRTKNRKQQIIPLSNTITLVLREYLLYRAGRPDDYLFCNRYGNKLTEDALRHSISKYNKRRGIIKTSVHLFRHTFAKKWILAGGDVFRLQKILGHSSIDIVKEYVNMYSGDLNLNFNIFNPLEQVTEHKQFIKMK